MLNCISNVNFLVNYQFSLFRMNLTRYHSWILSIYHSNHSLLYFVLYRCKCYVYTASSKTKTASSSPPLKLSTKKFQGLSTLFGDRKLPKVRIIKWYNQSRLNLWSSLLAISTKHFIGFIILLHNHKNTRIARFYSISLWATKRCRPTKKKPAKPACVHNLFYLNCKRVCVSNGNRTRQMCGCVIKFIICICSLVSVQTKSDGRAWFVRVIH